MRRAVEIHLDSQLKDQLLSLSRSRRESVRLVERCQIVLLAVDGLENKEIAARLNTTRQKADRWLERYARDGSGGHRKGRSTPGPYPCHFQAPKECDRSQNP